MELPIAIFIHNTVCWWELSPAASQETVLIQCGVLQAVCLRVMEYVHYTRTVWLDFMLNPYIYFPFREFPTEDDVAKGSYIDNRY